MKYKTIGILGGMGPAASAHFYSLLVKECQKNGAVQDTDFPKIILNSLTLEGFDETGIVDYALVLEQLQEGIKLLESAGAELIAIPCNTAHVFFEKLQSVTNVPLLNVVEETLAQVKETPAAVLASQSSHEYGLYPQSEKYQPYSATDLIEQVMQGAVTEPTKQSALSQVQGCKSIVLGCTELPLAISQADTKLPLYDSSLILAQATLKQAKQE